MIQNPPFQILGRKIAFSSLVQYFGKGIQIVLAGLILKTISYALGNSPEYTLYGTITEYALFFSVVANLGIFATVVKKMADEPLNSKIFINALFLRIVSAGFFFLLAFIFFLIQGVDATFLLAAGLFLASLFFDFITSVCDGMLQANYQMGRAMVALILGKIMTLLLVLFMAFGGNWLVFLKMLFLRTNPTDKIPVSLPVSSLFAALLLGSVITALVSLIFVSRKIKFSWKIDKTFMITILKMSLPFGIISICNSLYFRFLPDYFAHTILDEPSLLTHSSEQITSAFNVFNASFRIAQTVSLFSTVLMFSALPGLKQYIDAEHFQKAHHLYKRLLQLLAGCGLLLIIVGTIFSQKIVTLLTHQDFFRSEFWFVFPLMLVLAAVSYGYDLVLITLFAFEKERWMLKRELVVVGISLIFFAISLWQQDIGLRIFFILSGSIVAEMLMVFVGSRKVQQCFAVKTRVHIKA